MRRWWHVLLSVKNKHKKQSFKPSTLTKHDVIDGVSMHLFLVEARGEQFDVSSTTVDALLVFHCELDD